jgi:cysteine sulfinate desulfinase/cysteine desulfurase-like protein
MKLNSCSKNSHPRNLNIFRPNFTGEYLISKLSNINFSTRSVCSSGSAKSSLVISSITSDENVLKSAFRLDINKYNTIQEIDEVALKIIEVVKSIKNKKS